MRRTVNQYAVYPNGNKTYIGVEAQSIYRAVKFNVNASVKFSCRVDADRFFCNQMEFVIFANKKFRAEHLKLLCEIEHVIIAAVLEKTFFVVAVEVFNLRGVGGIA